MLKGPEKILSEKGIKSIFHTVNMISNGRLCKTNAMINSRLAIFNDFMGQKDGFQYDGN